MIIVNDEHGWNSLDEWTQIEINEVLESLFDMNYEQCLEDNGGCYINMSTRTWILHKYVHTNMDIT